MTYIIYLFIVSFLVMVDQYSKSLVVSYINEHQKIVIIKDFFNLTYVKNIGAGFSIMEGQRLILISITVVAIIGFTSYLLKTDKKKILLRIAILLIISGAIGNLIDRVSLHYVVDFLDFYIFGYDFPVFNVADSLLCIGVGLMLLDMFLEDRHATH